LATADGRGFFQPLGKVDQKVPDIMSRRSCTEADGKLIAAKERRERESSEPWNHENQQILKFIG